LFWKSLKWLQIQLNFNGIAEIDLIVIWKTAIEKVTLNQLFNKGVSITFRKVYGCERKDLL
jgi:hypothetical protein